MSLGALRSPPSQMQESGIISSSCVSMQRALAPRFESVLQHEEHRAGSLGWQSLVLLLHPERDRASGVSPRRELPTRLRFQLRHCCAARNVDSCKERAEPDLEPPQWRDAREPWRRLPRAVCSLVHCELHLQAARNRLTIGNRLPFIGWLEALLQYWRRRHWIS